MANELRDHVWVIDTASAANITNETVLVKGIRLVGTGAGDTATIENGDGVVVYQGKVPVAGDVDNASELCLRLVKGFSVPTLTAGAVLYIYGRLD